MHTDNVEVDHSELTRTCSYCSGLSRHSLHSLRRRLDRCALAQSTASNTDCRRKTENMKRRQGREKKGKTPPNQSATQKKKKHQRSSASSGPSSDDYETAHQDPQRRYRQRPKHHKRSSTVSSIKKAPTMTKASKASKEAAPLTSDRMSSKVSCHDVLVARARTYFVRASVRTLGRSVEATLKC